MPIPEPFSRRHQFAAVPPEITVWEDAPEPLRVTLLETVRAIGWSPSAIRTVVCRVLRIRADQGNWSEYPNIWGEVQYLVYDCVWFKVYDLIEAFHAQLQVSGLSRHQNGAQQFADEINACCVENGIGWQLADGQVVTRGSDTFEQATRAAAAGLTDTGRPTAGGHLQEALLALSRRPELNCPGAIYHAAGALECLMRDLSGRPGETLGEILKRRPDLVPKPLDTALSQVWGYASNEARHVAEGRNPGRKEAALVVGLAAALTTYLLQKEQPA